MHKLSVICCSLALLVLPICLRAQQEPAAQGGGGGHDGANCMQKAGLSPSTIQQIQSINRSTHQQLVSICQNTSLSAPQKREQLHQVQEKHKQQVEGLLTPEQLQTVKQCRGEIKENRGAGMTGHRGMGQGMGARGGSDPCGRILHEGSAR